VNTWTIALPNMFLMEANFIMEVVINCDVASCTLVDPVHVRVKDLSMRFVIIRLSFDKKDSMDHLMN
jgi:hypothetical protein